MKQTDKELLELFRQHAISHQVVLSKADRIVYGGSRLPKDEQLRERSENLRAICNHIRKDIQPTDSEGPVALGELIACSAEKSIDGNRIGINNLRWAVLAATGRNQCSNNHEISGTTLRQTNASDVQLGGSRNMAMEY